MFTCATRGFEVDQLAGTSRLEPSENVAVAVSVAVSPIRRKGGTPVMARFVTVRVVGAEGDDDVGDDGARCLPHPPTAMAARVIEAPRRRRDILAVPTANVHRARMPGQSLSGAVGFAASGRK